ncbi:hypothetical protein HDV62DRAFT_368657 [Trichoderma sp. SZMC 28011]
MYSSGSAGHLFCSNVNQHMCQFRCNQMRMQHSHSAASSTHHESINRRQLPELCSFFYFFPPWIPFFSLPSLLAPELGQRPPNAGTRRRGACFKYSPETALRPAGKAVSQEPRD